MAEQETSHLDLAGRPLPADTVEAVTPSGPSPTLQAAPQAMKRSWPMGLSILIGIVGAVFVGWIFQQLVWFLLLVYLAFLFATVLDVPVSWLTAHKVKRGLAATLVMVGIIILVGAVLYFASSALVTQFRDLAKNLQSLPDKVNAWVGHFRQTHPAFEDSLKGFDAHKMSSDMMGATQIKDAAFGLARNAGAMIELATAGIVLFFLTLYMCIDGPEYLRAARRLLPKGARLETSRVFDEMCTAHRGWFVASLGNVASSSILNTTGLFLLHVPGAPVLGIIAGLGELIPNIGPGLFSIPAFIVAVITPGVNILLVIAMFVVVQTIQGYGISPLVMKHGVALPPLVIIIAVLVMGTLFGALGVLVAIPLTSDLVVLWNYVNKALAKDAADNDTANAAPSQGAKDRATIAVESPVAVLAGVEPPAEIGRDRPAASNGTAAGQATVAVQKQHLLSRITRRLRG